MTNSSSFKILRSVSQSYTTNHAQTSRKSKSFAISRSSSSDTYSRKAALVLGEVNLHSKKAEKILGGLQPISREQRKSMDAHYTALAAKKELEAAKFKENVLAKNVSVEQVMLPGKIDRPMSEKALKLAGDEILDHQSKFLVRKCSLTAKSIKLTGHAVEQLVGRKASQVFGDDTVTTEVESMVRKRSSRQLFGSHRSFLPLLTSVKGR